MKSKKLICIALSLAMIASAAGCGGSTGAATAGGDATAEAAAEAGAAEAGADEAAEPAADAGAADGAEAEAGAAEAGADEAAEPAADAGAADGAEADAGAADGAAAAGEEIAEADISVKWDDSHIYTSSSLGNYSTVRTYEVKGYEDVPFMRASDYLRLTFEGKERVSMENGVMTLAINGTTATIDPATDTMRIEDAAVLRGDSVVSGAVVDLGEYDIVTPSVKNQSTETEKAPVEINFKDYHMPVVLYEDDILMPFLGLQNSFGGITWSNHYAYNGKDYYNVNSITNNMEDHRDTIINSPYYKGFHSGPFSTMLKTTQAYADYGYYSICLLLDLTFGHKKEKNITTFDEYFTRMNAKKSMCSTDPTAAVTAEILLFNYLFDSGHDSIMSVDTVFGEKEVDQETVDEITNEIKESEEGQELFNDEDIEQNIEEDQGVADAVLGALLEKGFKAPEVVPMMIWHFYMKGNVPEGYGDQRLDYAGDTAVIYFTAFKDDTTTRKESFHLLAPTEEDEATSNFAFFYNCFEDIKQHDEVKNVVINLANNGGGAANGLICILGFLSEDGEVNFTDLDTMTGSFREERYHIDTNLDGIADDQDGFGGQYDFYILCSGSSYSCGTALPYFAQKDGLAKVIGAKPGGGDCVVGNFVDAYGRSAAYSGFLKLGKYQGSEFISDEKDVALDYDMMPSIIDIGLVPWYDAEGIAEAVHNCQNGETAAVYSEEAEGEVISKFLMSLLEKIASAEESK